MARRGKLALGLPWSLFSKALTFQPLKQNNKEGRCVVWSHLTRMKLLLFLNRRDLPAIPLAWCPPGHSLQLSRELPLCSSHELSHHAHHCLHDLKQLDLLFPNLFAGVPIPTPKPFRAAVSFVCLCVALCSVGPSSQVSDC